MEKVDEVVMENVSTQKGKQRETNHYEGNPGTPAHNLWSEYLQSIHFYVDQTKASGMSVGYTSNAQSKFLQTNTSTTEHLQSIPHAELTLLYFVLHRDRAALKGQVRPFVGIIFCGMSAPIRQSIHTIHHRLME